MIAALEIQPQMFFVRSCAERLPEWLKTPIPLLGVFDKPIRFLSVLDRPLNLGVPEAIEQPLWDADIPEAVLADEEADCQVLSFYIEGPLCFGVKSKYAINGEDFYLDENTVISGELVYGAYAAVQGVLEDDGRQRATIIVSDVENVH